MKTYTIKSIRNGEIRYHYNIPKRLLEKTKKALKLNYEVILNVYPSRTLPS